MPNPIAPLIGDFLGALSTLVVFSMLALKIETANRQWPWLIVWGLVGVGAAAVWACQAFLADTYVAGTCR